MKYFFITNIIFLPILLFPQSEGDNLVVDEFVISVNTPLFYQHNLPDKNQLVLIPFEYILNRPNLSKTSISFSIGNSISEKLKVNWDYYVGAEISRIIPIRAVKGLYFEIGGGGFLGS